MKILYFANIKQEIGISEENIIIENKISIFELIELLKKRGLKYKNVFSDVKNIKCSVNCIFSNFDTMIENEDEIAFFPPVTGG